MYAAQLGHLPLLKMLIEHGANVLHKGSVSYTRQWYSALLYLLHMLPVLLSCPTTPPTVMCSAKCLCVHMLCCGEVLLALVLLHMLHVSTLSTHCHPSVLCVALFLYKVMPCLPTFLQRGRDCFLIACKEGHQEIVHELLTRDEVDRNAVDKVRN